MKSIILGLITMIMTCKATEKIVETPVLPISEKVNLLCIAAGCSEKAPLGIYEFNGIGFDKIKEAEKVGQDSFMITMPAGEGRFYYVGQDESQKRPIIFGNDTTMELRGTCRNMRAAKISGSNANISYDEIMSNVRANQSKMQSAINDYRRNFKVADEREKATAILAEIDAAQMNYLESLKKNDLFLAKVAALNTYLSFPNHQADYTNEVDYFAGEYFSHVDLKDPDYNRIPAIFEAFKNYSQTMASVGFQADKVEALIEQHLSQIDQSGNAYRYALGGAVIGLQAKNNAAFSNFAKRFINRYEASTDANSIKRLKSQLNQSKSFVEGSEAPDFTQNTPEGEPVSLSEFRGNVVLIDFWASWCGPCRKENPNVVRLYDKYKDKGFEILGVSLDKDMTRWTQAIEKDGLDWKHVSDLKGWKNEVAATYGVRSIPHTVLLDAEGKIIARNLRGPALERKLAKLFKE